MHWIFVTGYGCLNNFQYSRNSLLLNLCWAGEGDDLHLESQEMVDSDFLILLLAQVRYLVQRCICAIRGPKDWSVNFLSSSWRRVNSVDCSSQSLEASSFPLKISKSLTHSLFA